MEGLGLALMELEADADARDEDELHEDEEHNMHLGWWLQLPPVQQVWACHDLGVGE